MGTLTSAGTPTAPRWRPAPGWQLEEAGDLIAPPGDWFRLEQTLRQLDKCSGLTSSKEGDEWLKS